MLAANFLQEVERRRLVGGGGGRRRRRSVPPEAEVQILLSEQRLGQRQVEVRHAAAVQHQDLVAGTQAFAERQTVGENFADEDAAVLLAVDVARDGKPCGGGEGGGDGGDEGSHPDSTQRSRRGRLTEVPAAVGPGHVQHEHVGRHHLQLLVHLHGDITSTKHPLIILQERNWAELTRGQKS